VSSNKIEGLIKFHWVTRGIILLVICLMGLWKNQTWIVKCTMLKHLA